METKITYILGAGASADALPIVSQFTERLEAQIQSVFISRGIDKKVSASNWTTFISHYQSIIFQVKSHKSVDTYAKKLYFQNNIQDLRKLSGILSIFLMIEEYINEPDKRYDAFFASILEKTSSGSDIKIKVPDNINILSWNYDSQLEFSLSQFMECSPLEVDKHLNFIPNCQSNNINSNQSTVIKLNGSANLISGKSVKRIIADESKTHSKPSKLDKDKIAMLAVNLYVDIWQKNIQSMVYYSWDKYHLIEEGRDKALTIIENTDILVVIGYSFPTFNRAMDKKLLNRVFKKIYVQTIDEKSFRDIEIRIRSLRNEEINNYKQSSLQIQLELPVRVPIIPIISTDEFFIPFEFN